MTAFARPTLAAPADGTGLTGPWHLSSSEAQQKVMPMLRVRPLVLLLAVLACTRPAAADDAKGVLSRDEAAKRVLTVATTWPADLLDHRAIMRVVGEPTWAATTVRKVSASADDPWRQTDGAYDLPDATPFSQARALDCTRFGRPSLDRIQRLFAGTGDQIDKDWFYQLDSQDVYSAVLTQYIPAEAIAAQSCVIFLLVAPGGAPADSPALRAAFRSFDIQPLDFFAPPVHGEAIMADDWQQGSQTVVSEFKITAVSELNIRPPGDLGPIPALWTVRFTSWLKASVS